MVNVDRTRDLHIFSLTLSKLTYPHNVVMSELISELCISVSVNIILWCFSCLIEITKNYSSFLSGLDGFFSVLVINPISNMLHINDLIFTQINFNFDLRRCLNYSGNEYMFVPFYTYFLPV